MIHLLLFDVDGVLVEPRGYLKALQDTVTRFSRQMGLGELPPTEQDVHAFEACGLTSEWDSGAACVGALLLERLRREPSIPLPSRWPDVLSLLAAHPHPLSKPDYASLAEKIGRHLNGNITPSQATHIALWNEAQTIPGLGPSQPALAALLDALLGHTHDFYRAPVTRTFQHLAIGSRGVAKTYGVSPDFESPAYLERFDRPLLAPEVRDKLERARGCMCIALYTLRPSLPPIEAEEQPMGYSPEAEMARSLVGLEVCPLIGLGRIQWLARRSGEDVGRLVKPFPVQALAAIGAAWSGQEMAALEAALTLHRDGTLYLPLADLPAVTLHVIEDTSDGLAAVKSAVEALRAAGSRVEWQAYGIASTGSPKAASLTAGGALIYPSVNEAALAALKQV